MHQNHFDVTSQDLSVKITIKQLFQAVNGLFFGFSIKYNTWKLTNKLSYNMLYKGDIVSRTEVKNLNNFTNFKSAVRELVELAF